jgi:hypothetical protein
MKRDDVKRKRLAELGIDYEFEGYQQAAPKKAKTNDAEPKTAEGNKKNDAKAVAAVGGKVAKVAVPGAGAGKEKKTKTKKKVSST